MLIRVERRLVFWVVRWAKKFIVWAGAQGLLREDSYAMRWIKLLVLLRGTRRAAFRRLVKSPWRAIRSLLSGRDVYELNLSGVESLHISPSDLVALVDVSAELPFLEAVSKQLAWQLPNGFRATTYPEIKLDMVAFAEIFLREVYKGDYGGLRILDIGAYHGYTALYFLSRGAQSVVCVEPSPQSVERLRAQVLANPHASLQVYPVALGAQPGEAHLGIEGPPLLHTLQLASVAEANLRVPVWNLAQLLDTIGWDAIDLAKVNCEGCEHALLLQSAAETLLRVRAYWVQVHGSPDAIQKRLLGLGYRTSWLAGWRGLGFLRAHLAEARAPWRIVS